MIDNFDLKFSGVSTKPEQPDEEATYKEKLDLQLRKDRCYTLIYTNISSDLKNLITETTDGVAAWKILKDHFEPVTRAREFQSTVQQIYRWKEEDFRVVKIEAELILEANRLQLMKQDLEKAENAYLSGFTSKKSKTLPGATAAAHGDPNGKNDYQKKSGDKGVWVIDTAATSHFCNDKSLFLDLKPITNMKMSLATEDKSCPVEGIGTLRFRGYRIWLIDENKLVETFNVRFDENKRGINFRQKVNSNLGYNLNLPDYYDDEDDFDRVKDSLTSRLVSKTSTETPSTSEKPDVSSDNHSLIPCTEVKWIRNIGRKVTGSNVYYSIEGEVTRLKSFNEIERYYLSEQQEALMVEVTIPNCYKQAIRSRDASKWHDAMDKEINVMMERKVWDLVDHPDNIKILENRWVYTIKYDENNKIVRYKARLVARDTVIYMKQPTGYEIDNNKVCKLRKAIYGLHQSGRQWFLELENKLIKLKFKNLADFVRDMEALMELRASWTSMDRTPTGFKQHRNTNCSAFSEITTLQTFFFSSIKTWTAVREPGVREVPVEWKKSFFVNLKEGRSDGRSPVPKDCNCNFYICPALVVYNEEFGMRLFYPTEKGDAFPRLEEGIAPINMSWYRGVFGNFPRLGDVIDCERISFR
ncbi:retrovirus-related Pol polyprotein from transposon RE1 [Trichonephila clavipes]|nr:retrovirus-related Pol polyprotein from transposon RE1 [Trichonephila clavipes]